MFLLILGKSVKVRKREREREKKKHQSERETSVVFGTHSYWGPNPQHETVS